MSRKSLIPLMLVSALIAGPAHAEQDHERHLLPETIDYALILPANLPHVLRLPRFRLAGWDSMKRRKRSFAS